MKRITVIKIMVSLFVLIIMLTGCSDKTFLQSLGKTGVYSDSNESSEIIEIGIHKTIKPNPEMHGTLDSFPEAPNGNTTRIDVGSYDISKLDLSKYEDLLYYIRFNTKTI
ncbi:hypothetical protein RBU61_06810 [Tissierella sp. MB52-C2]|uniref:hypothetical protein n=1 Tax=Tissierella sp. MB52-C2 TaxID=3070999 RepID=UPI00280A90F9|nr:hypothetical protein [Tissierella sp. MB52-C2]WMM26377.1 hypothetical protein RBU61_06810 [Tissierella sp. MB52-C2]